MQLSVCARYKCLVGLVVDHTFDQFLGVGAVDGRAKVGGDLLVCLALGNRLWIDEHRLLV